MQYGEKNYARERKALANRLQQLRWQKLVGAPKGGEAVSDHEASDANAKKACRRDEPRIRSTQQIAGAQANQQLRHGDPYQGLTYLERSKTAHDLQELRDREGGGQDRQAQKGDQQQQTRQGRGEHDFQIDRGAGRA